MEAWPELTIGEVARRAGIAASTVRYYESIGLLPEPARESGQRRYHESVLGQLGFIGIAKEAGFSLSEIRELMEGADHGKGMSGSMRSLSAKKLDEVEALLERAKVMKDWLAVAKECGCRTPEECALFPTAGEGSAEVDLALTLTHVRNGECRQEPV